MPTSRNERAVSTRSAACSAVPSQRDRRSESRARIANRAARKTSTSRAPAHGVDDGPGHSCGSRMFLATTRSLSSVLISSPLKSDTLTSIDDAHNIADMTYNVSPVVKVAVRPKDERDLPKLVEGLKKLSKWDPLFVCTTEESGEHVIAGLWRASRCELSEGFARRVRSGETSLWEIWWCSTERPSPARQARHVSPSRPTSTIILTSTQSHCPTEIESGMRDAKTDPRNMPES